MGPDDMIVFYGALGLDFATITVSVLGGLLYRTMYVYPGALKKEQQSKPFLNC